MAALGRFMLIWTVSGSIASAGLSASIWGRMILAKLLGSWTIRLMFQTTASAFRSEPSWNFTFGWSLIVSLLPEMSQDFASSGWTP